MFRSRTYAVALVGWLLAAGACDSPAKSPSDAGSTSDAARTDGGGAGSGGPQGGNAGNVGGAGGGATGGKTSSGGVTGSGGKANSGGVTGSSSGGTTGSGGKANSGGTIGSGGTPASGGSGGGTNIGGSTVIGSTGGRGGGSGSAGGAGGTLQAKLTAAMASYDFGDLEVGVAAATPFQWSISNTGAAATGALSLTSDSDAEIVATNACSTGLAPGAMCQLTIAFKAAQPGTRTVMLTLSNSASVSVTARLTARGAYRVTVMTMGTGTVTMQPGDVACGASCSFLVDPGWIRLRANTTNGSGFYFSGWSDAFCQSPARECALPIVGSETITARFAPMAANLIFMTAATFPANLGSAESYDLKCNLAATAAGINDTAGTGYVAMMSDAASLAKNRLGTARGWTRMDGAPFADTQDSLFTDGRVYNSVRFDELGTRLSARDAFTGADPAGALSIFNCSNWTSRGQGASAAELAMLGSSDGGPGRWSTGSSDRCSTDRALVCLGKTRDAAVSPNPAVGKRIWQSAPYTIGTRTPDAQCAMNLPTGVTSARALISSPTQPASMALSPSAVYVRPDGIRVGTGVQLAMGALDSGIWQSASGAYSVKTVWTGSTTVATAGTADSTCANWTGTTGMGQIAWGDADGAFWWNFNTQFCSEPVALYCIEP